MRFPTYKNELEKFAEGFEFVAGCDEVGVSPLAGPVVAGACIIDPKVIGAYRSKNKWYYRVRDSKTVNEYEREKLAEEIKSHCLAYGIGEASPIEIDAINIHHATLLAMKRAVSSMLADFNRKYAGDGKDRAMFLFLDGRFILRDLAAGEFKVSQKAVVAGDAKILSISAASIIAKVHRDGLLKRLHHQFPKYGFAKHKGYNTKEHRKALLENGITEFHRKSFLRNIILQKQY